jgi:CRP-like cAMP-binding protein
MTSECSLDTASVAIGFSDAAADSHSYPAGVRLFIQGARADAVYLLQQGLVKLTRSEANGHEVIVDLRFPGSFVGSAAAIREAHHPFTAMTATRCQLTRWNCRGFLLRLGTDELFSKYVVNALSNEVIDHIAHISQLACLPARQRLEQFLWQLGERLEPGTILEHSSGEAKLQLPLKHSEVADLLSVTPTYLCRLFNSLEADRVIERSKGWIVIKRSELWHSSIGKSVSGS